LLAPTAAKQQRTFQPQHAAQRGGIHWYYPARHGSAFDYYQLSN